MMATLTQASRTEQSRSTRDMSLLRFDIAPYLCRPWYVPSLRDLSFRG